MIAQPDSPAGATRCGANGAGISASTCAACATRAANTASAGRDGGSPTWSPRPRNTAWLGSPSSTGRRRGWPAAPTTSTHAAPTASRRADPKLPRPRRSSPAPARDRSRRASCPRRRPGPSGSSRTTSAPHLAAPAAAFGAAWRRPPARTSERFQASGRDAPVAQTVPERVQHRCPARSVTGFFIVVLLQCCGVTPRAPLGPRALVRRRAQLPAWMLMRRRLARARPPRERRAWSPHSPCGDPARLPIDSSVRRCSQRQMPRAGRAATSMGVGGRAGRHWRPRGRGGGAAVMVIGPRRSPGSSGGDRARLRGGPAGRCPRGSSPDSCWCGARTGPPCQRPRPPRSRSRRRPGPTAGPRAAAAAATTAACCQRRRPRPRRQPPGLGCGTGFRAGVRRWAACPKTWGCAALGCTSAGRPARRDREDMGVSPWASPAARSLGGGSRRS